MATDTDKTYRAFHPKFNIAAGAGASTNIAITGITTSDVLLCVVEVVDPASAATPVLIDRSATTSITSAGNIQCTSATNTTANHRLLVIWQDSNG